MHLDPNWMTVQFQQRIGRWLDANGCTHLIALEPVTVQGNVAVYTALVRKTEGNGARWSNRHLRGDGIIPIGRKKLRIRIPLSAVA